MRPVMAKAIGYLKPDIGPNTRLYVPFNEGVGSVAKDYSQYGNHAQLTDVEWSPDGFNGAEKFNGASAFGDCGNDTSLNITDAITIEVWANIVDDGTYKFIVAKDEYTGNTNKGYNLFVAATALYWRLGDGISGHTVTSECTTYFDKLTRIVGIWNGVTQRLYFNGVEVGTSVDWSGTISYTAGRDCLIGSHNSYWLNGTIDNVIISTTVKNPAQIAADCYEVVCN